VEELTLAQVMLPEDANPRGNVHGGTLMKLADSAGGVCATRHASRLSSATDSTSV
jgi:acyl-CoA hydrolase